MKALGLVVSTHGEFTSESPLHTLALQLEYQLVSASDILNIVGE